MNDSRALRAEFLGRPGDRIFALLHTPSAARARGCVLFVPPFAEELNKSRRMMAQTARALAESGLAAATIDLYGTGDSDGEFEQATWDRWVSDVCDAEEWCAHEGYPVRSVVGIRVGCALAAAAAARFREPVQSAVFWQPVPAGARVLEQFLRLRVAASMMEQDRKETVKDLRDRLRHGETLEVAGYQLSSALAAAMDAINLAELAGPATDSIHWMDVVREQKPPTPPTASALESLRSRGRTVAYHQIIGEPFWSSTEIVSIPDLLARTVDVLRAAA